VVAGVATAEALMAWLVALKVLNASTQARCHGWRVFDLIVSLSGDALTASAMPPVPPADGPPKSSVAVRDLMDNFFVKSALTTMSLFRRTECRHRRRRCGGVVRMRPATTTICSRCLRCESPSMASAKSMLELDPVLVAVLAPPSLAMMQGLPCRSKNRCDGLLSSHIVWHRCVYMCIHVYVYDYTCIFKCMVNHSQPTEPQHHCTARTS